MVLSSVLAALVNSVSNADKVSLLYKLQNLVKLKAFRTKN